MSEEKKAVEQKTAEVPKKKAKSNVDAFIERKLKAINAMSNPAKAKRSAERVLMNRKRGN